MLIVAGALDDDVRLFVPAPPTSDAPAATSIITLLLLVLELSLNPLVQTSNGTQDSSEHKDTW